MQIICASVVSSALHFVSFSAVSSSSWSEWWTYEGISGLSETRVSIFYIIIKKVIRNNSTKTLIITKLLITAFASILKLFIVLLVFHPTMPCTNFMLITEIYIYRRIAYV